MYEVHEADLERNYNIIKEFLIQFSFAKLPSVEHCKAPAGLSSGWRGCGTHVG